MSTADFIPPATSPRTVRHWHVTESPPGCHPESVPYTGDCADLALDTLAHELIDYADTLEGEDGVYAAAVGEIYCTCRSDSRSAEHWDSVYAAERAGLSEIIAGRYFELIPCEETDCLKYCPDPDCGTVTPVTDSDDRCWCCGSRYIDADHRPGR